MSALCGLIHTQQQPVPPVDVNVMLAAMAHRGPDGQHLWHDNNAGLGHLMLHTTPESLEERLPFVDPQRRMAITADVRLDNRTDLMAALAMASDPDTVITDSALVLAAYARWGTACPAQLLGDFAFAIWDAPLQTLFCARDPFGVKPLYYVWAAPHFAFATEIKGLLALPFVPRAVDQGRIADFLLLTIADHASTFYAAIKRLPPAHTLAVSPRGLQIQPYWSLRDAPDVRFGSDAAYSEAFRALFVEAVRCRMRSHHPVGAELSGGVDSSAVACVARDVLAADGVGPLPTFSAVMPDVPLSDERAYIDAVLATGGMTAHLYRADQSPTLPDPDDFLFHLEEPFGAVNLFLSWHMAQQARQAGVRVLLTGKDGDSAVSHGVGWLAELAYSGRWDVYAATLDDILDNLASDGPAMRRMLHQDYGFPVLTRHMRSLAWWRVPGALNALGRITGVSRRRLLREYVLRPLVPAWLWSNPAPALPLLKRFDPAFASRLAGHIAMRRQPVPPPTSERDAHIRAVTSPFISRTWELLDRVAAAAQIEARHPFYDRRLVAFCVGLPGDRKVREGMTRWILRAALRDVLPPAVLSRRSKAHLGHNFAHMFQQHERAAWYAAVTAAPDVLRPYVNLDALAGDFAATADTTAYSGRLLALWIVLLLGQWLQQQHVL